MKKSIIYNGSLFVVGNNYIIDKEFNNNGWITLIAIYGNYYCKVRDIKNGYEWDTLINRLSIE